MNRMSHLTAAVLLTLGLSHAVSFADAPAAPRAQDTLDKGLLYLKAQQKPDMSWQREFDPPAISALVLKAFVQDAGKYDAEDPFLDKGFAKLLSYQKPSGGIYKDMLANYNTAIAVSALAASHEAEYANQLGLAVKYLKGLQWRDKIDGAPDTAEANVATTGPSDVREGGFGYGRAGRPDLSNVQIAIDALHDSGLKPEDPAYQAALKFVSRTQNSSETNDQPWAGNDGGFVYSPVGISPDKPGQSPAGEYTSPDGKRLLRSYGSMTYAGLKSMIYAGLSKDDPRVKAAWAWIQKNYTFEENPGMKLNDPAAAQAGLYYYYLTAARALRAYGEPTITDSQGAVHDWRADLTAKLASLQKEDGSWVGEKKWMEDNSILVTAYGVLTLEEVTADLKEHPVK